MKLLSLQVHNFRQFYKTSPRLDFAHGEKNVTVIHGANGSGKTALLNAFTWALYESHTEGFLFPDQLLNKRAIWEADIGSKLAVWVEVKFEALEHRYRLRREAVYERIDAKEGVRAKGSATLTLQKANHKGEWKESKKPEDEIGRVLPQELHTYFFFDGERIERLVQPDKHEREQMASATRQLLGVEVLERGGRHLQKAVKSLEEELQAVGDSQVAELIKAKLEKEEELTDKSARMTQIEDNLIAREREKRKVEEVLRQTAAVSEMQGHRDELNRRQTALKASLDKTRSDISRSISEIGYSVFLVSAINDFEALVDGLRQRGELPAGIKRQFVQDLIKKGVCICERKLESGEPPYTAVMQWLNRAGLADVEEEAIRMGGEVNRLRENAGRFWTGLNAAIKRESEERDDLARITDELDAIHEKLRASSVEEVKKLEARRAEIDELVQNELSLKASVHHELELLRAEIATLVHDIETRKGKAAKQELARRRVQSAGDARRRVERVSELLVDQVRRDLEASLRQTYRQISVTPYVPRLSKEFVLQLDDGEGGRALPVAASQGENQILSLAFITCIIDLVKRSEERKELTAGDAQYPVVMDSPFGALDSTYRRQIAEHVPAVADQVVLMVSKTQWRGEVEEALSEEIGRSYLINYFTPRDDIAEDEIEIGGRGYRIVARAPDDHEYSEIQEVESG